MSFVFFNPNPRRIVVEDCSVRAISLLTKSSWEDTYIGLAYEGFSMGDMPNSNNVIGSYLIKHGFVRGNVPPQSPCCYSVRDFCFDHPYGSYMLATGTHVIAIVNGDYYDTWDSGDECPVYCWRKEE